MFRRKKRSLEDLQEEIRSHLAIEADETGEQAARRAFGNVTAVEERWYEQRRWMWFHHFRRDIRHAFRQIRRNPGFAATVILTLALGTGADSAIFGVLDAVLLRPLPYRDPAHLAMLFAGNPARELHEGRVSLANFRDWRSQSHSFEGMTAFIGQTFLLGTEGSPERLRSARVEANFWQVLGVKPLLGRVFTAEEERAGERVAVLSYSLWQQRFGGSREVTGAELRMDNRTYRVIGVMPPEFRFPFPDTKVWEPVTAHPYWTERDRAATRAESIWLVMGRLKRGVTWRQAQDEMNGIAARLRAQYPAPEMPDSIPLVPIESHLTGQYRASLWLLFGAVSLILFIACINVAGLLLARGPAREREFAVRRALGAGRLRIARQILTETMVLAACGAALGLLLASAGIAAVQTFGPADIPRLAEARVDWRVALFTAGIAIVTALFAGVWPAFGSGPAALTSRSWNSRSMRRTGDLLVIGEFALALVLVISATLLIRSFTRLRAVELGYQPDHLLSMRIDLHVGRTQDQEAAYFEEAIRRAQAVPGVQNAAAISGFLRTDPEDGVQIEGRAMQHPGPCRDTIDGPFFQTAGIPLLRGRYFSSDDRRGSLPVAIINDVMARAYWPGEDPIGKRFRFNEAQPWLTVVGVTGGMRRQGLDHGIAPQAFVPHRQDSEDMMDVLVRTNSDALAPVVRQQIQAIDRNVAQFQVHTVLQELGEETSERRFDTFLIAGFALTALFLSAIGIYGLLHHLVGQRTSEIGVRMALGAQPQEVMSMVLRQGLTLAAAGAVLGTAGAFLSSRLLSAMLYDTAPRDPFVFSLSVTVLLLVAAVACWLPSRAAAGIDPMVALRHE